MIAHSLAAASCGARSHDVDMERDERELYKVNACMHRYEWRMGNAGKAW